MPTDATIIVVSNMTLKEIRRQYFISQATAAATIGMPLRTYIRYENDEAYGDSLKRQSAIACLNDVYQKTETRGIYTIEEIKSLVKETIETNYKEVVDFCYLFGSYAKGYAKETSDVDLCVSTTLSGLKFVGLVGALKTAIKKEVDVIRLSDLSNNIALMNEIMKDGIKIYG